MERAEEIVPGMAEAIEQRRVELGLTLGDLADASGLTRQGLVPLRKGYRRAYQDKVRIGLARALDWPNDALDRLMRGESPTTFATNGRRRASGTDSPIQLDASGADLEELRLTDPDAYQLLLDMARAALDRARARRRE